MRVFLLSMLAATCLLLGGTLVHAQPLVTGGLSLYYSFDATDEDGFWADGSGNNLPGLTVLGDTDANEDGKKDIRLDTQDKKRGAGSVWFETDPLVKEDRIAVCDVNFYMEGCDAAIAKNVIPTDGFTVAAWVKVETAGTEHGIWQSQAEGGGFIHTQIQSSGNMRFTLRGDLNSDNIVNDGNILTPDGGPVPYGEWFHYAGTYNGDSGTWAFYYNGEKVNEGDALIDAPLGNWAKGAFIGLVPDFNRQLVGRLDDFYLFNRGITEAEVQIS